MRPRDDTPQLPSLLGRCIVNVSCIIVSYRPDVSRLVRLCAKVQSDGATVILVDNTEVPHLKSDMVPDGCTLITLGFNSGIAHAQNAGVAAALAAGAAVLVFFDQDSKIEPGFLSSLVGSIDAGAPEIVAPLCIDETSDGAQPAERLNRYGFPTMVHDADALARYPVDIVISSGTVATREVFEIAGTFDEDFFIDYVDAEWCLRCRSKNIPIYVVPTSVMRHSVGSGRIRLGPLTISIHSPARCYYQIRNAFLLFRKSSVPRAFAAKQLLSAILTRILLLFFVNDRLSYLKSYLFAVRDGIKGSTGANPR
jgi:rhamnosyltransferase